MRLTVAAARSLVEGAMTAAGHDAGSAALIADHLIDCELRGLHYGRLSRALSIVERLTATASRPRWSSSATRPSSRGSTAVIRSVTWSRTAHANGDRQSQGQRPCGGGGTQHLVHRHAVVLRRDG